MKASIRALALFASIAAAVGFSACSSTETEGSRVDISGAALPASPTKEQARAYVMKILESSKDVRTQGADDPQVKALSKVGAKNIDVLIDSLGAYPCSCYPVFAVVNLANSESKALVISKMPEKRTLASVVFAKGWESDAKAQLLDGLRNSKTGLPYDWLRAAAKLKSQEANTLVKEHFVKHPWAPALKVIQDNEIAISPAELDAAFANLKSYEGGISPKMAKAGSKLALLHIVQVYKSEGKPCPASIIKLTAYEGDAKGFPAWAEANKDKLRFDRKQERFVLN